MLTELDVHQVVLFHVLEEVAAKSPSGKTIVDIAKYRPMSRLGGNFYGVLDKARQCHVFVTRHSRVTPCISWTGRPTDNPQPLLHLTVRLFTGLSNVVLSELAFSPQLTKNASQLLRITR